MKFCNKCQTTKDFTDFAIAKNRKDGRHPTCKQCVREYGRKHYSKNKTKIRQDHKEWYEANKKKKLAKDAEWREANKERKLYTTKVWAQKNKDKRNSVGAKYRAAKRKGTPEWLTEKDYQLIEAKYAMAAWLSDVVGIKYHIDHIVPLNGKNVCGLHVPDNLQIIPAKENLSKGNRYNG
jgi:hypothetical protein